MLAEVEQHFKIRFSYFELILSFFRFLLVLIEWLSKFLLFMHMHMQCHDIWRSYTFLTKRKFCPIYKAYVYSVAIALIPVVSFNESSLRNRG
jgi:hypothetical protein